MSRARFAVPIMLFLAAFAAAPGVASAVYSYQGSDYSYNTSDKKIMYTCDEESDETKVKANYRRNSGSSGNVYDTDGNNNVCASGYVNLSNQSDYVVEHKTCEYRSAWPDTCGNWQAT